MGHPCRTVRFWLSGPAKSRWQLRNVVFIDCGILTAENHRGMGVRGLLVLLFLLVLTGIPMMIIPLPLAHHLKSKGLIPDWVPLPPVGGPRHASAPSVKDRGVSQ